MDEQHRYLPKESLQKMLDDVESMVNKKLSAKERAVRRSRPDRRDVYRLTGTRYVDNQVYGPFPVCS